MEPVYVPLRSSAASLSVTSSCVDFNLGKNSSKAPRCYTGPVSPTLFYCMTKSTFTLRLECRDRGTLKLSPPFPSFAQVSSRLVGVLKWEYPVKLNTASIVHDGSLSNHLYLYDGGYSVSCLNKYDGSLQWKHKVTQRVSCMAMYESL